MSARLNYSTETPVETIEELSRVALQRPVDLGDQPRQLPIGSSGTIVSVLEGGAAYLVEFTEPFPALVELAAEDVEVIPGESRGDLVAGRLARRAS